jgi:putative oxidoreductase
MAVSNSRSDATRNFRDRQVAVARGFDEPAGEFVSALGAGLEAAAPRRSLAGATHSLVRIVAGLLFVCHGGMKLFGWFGGMPQGTGLTPLVAAAGVIELVGGVAIALGFFTVTAAFIASGEMAVAYFKAHFPKGFWPIQNEGELAVLYCFLFLFLWANGPGPWSLDHALARRRATVRTSTKRV